MITILYVDDEMGFLELGKFYLEMKGLFSVDINTSASAALTLLQSMKYDAIISDYEMPKMDGIEFLKRVRASGNTIPFILFTGRGREDVVIQALNEGADYYLQKGGDPKSLYAELSHKVRLAVQKRQAESALEESEERYRAVLEVQTELICRFMPDGRLTFVNDAYCRYFNLEKDRCLGEPNPVHLPPEDAIRMREHLASLTVENPFGFIEHRIRMPDGIFRLHRWNDRAIFNKDGRVVEYQSVGMDITAQKEAEDAIKQSEEQASVLIDHIQDGAFLSQDGILLLCNEKLAEMVGYTKKEATGMPVSDLIAPEDRDMVMGRQRARLAGEALLESYEFRLLHKDGITRVPVMMSVGTGIYRGQLAVIGTLHSKVKELERESALKMSEKKYRDIYNNACIGLFKSTPEGRYISANPRAVTYLGYDSEEDLIQSVTDIRTQVYADPEEREEAFRLMKTQGFIENYEVRFYRKDGRVIWGSISARVTHDENGNIIIEGTSLDINDRKKAESALRESENRYRTLFEGAAEGILVADITTQRFVHANPMICRMLGYTENELIKMTLADIHPVKDLSYVLNEFKAIARGEKTRATAIPCLRKDGTVIYADITCSHGVIEGKMCNIGFFSDITERKQTEEALRESEKRMRRIYESGLFGVIFWNIDGDITDANDKFLEMLGYTREDLTNGLINAFTLTPPEYAQIDEVAISEFKKYGIHNKPYEKEYIKKDGTRIPVVLAGALLDEQQIECVGFVLDITDLKRIEISLRKVNRQLTLMTGIIRHDIKNKIFTILSYLDLEKTNENYPGIEEFIGKLESITYSIQSQIEFTRVYENLGSSDPQWLGIDKLLQSQKVPASVTLASTVSGLEVYADAMLNNVFLNLLDNSLKHGQFVTMIHVSSRRLGDDLVIIWEDNGIGIPPDEKEKIFQRGFGKNTGLGLFLVRDILSITDITIKETGLPGKGARFEILVPKGKYHFLYNNLP